MSKCDAFIPDLVDAADNELSPARRPAFERHLEACADCRAELSALGDTNALLTATRNEPDPLTLSGFAYRTALAAEAQRDRKPFGAWRRWSRSARATVYVATVAGAMALALLVVPSPQLPVAPSAVSLDEIATAEELHLWNVYSDDDDAGFPIELAGLDATLSLDNGLAELTDMELAELVQLLNDGSKG